MIIHNMKTIILILFIAGCGVQHTNVRNHTAELCPYKGFGKDYIRIPAGTTLTHQNNSITVGKGVYMTDRFISSVRNGAKNR
jgi:hypothetical protein